MSYLLSSDNVITGITIPYKADFFDSEGSVRASMTICSKDIGHCSEVDVLVGASPAPLARRYPPTPQVAPQVAPQGTPAPPTRPAHARTTAANHGWR